MLCCCRERAVRGLKQADAKHAKETRFSRNWLKSPNGQDRRVSGLYQGATSSSITLRYSPTTQLDIPQGA